MAVPQTVQCFDLLPSVVQVAFLSVVQSDDGLCPVAAIVSVFLLPQMLQINVLVPDLVQVGCSVLCAEQRRPKR